MRMYDTIDKKKRGQELTEQEIRDMIESYTSDAIPDYQMASFLMAVYFQGMTDKELSIMTDAMAHSGDVVDLSAINGVKVDKHSTGGVGDKTTLVVGPLVASYGVKVAKMSGRGLGHTGGTMDKMEAIPGMQVSLPIDTFFKNVNDVGISIVGQSGNLAPADKKLYALRDVTATVDSIPLIAASIMSKKLAAGNDCIVLDVKTGSGAFMKTVEDAILLANKMVAIGEANGKKTVGLITDMDIPLGKAIGNSLEVIEAIDTLRGKGPEDLTKVCVHLSANMLYLAGKGTLEQCIMLAEKAICDGSGYRKLLEFVKAQGGDISVIEDTEMFKKAPYRKDVLASNSGYIAHMDTESCGIASMMLGAGRETKDSVLDYAAGIMLEKKTGDYVKKGETLAVLYASDERLFKRAEDKLLSAFTMEEKEPEAFPLVLARVEKEKVERFS